MTKLERALAELDRLRADGTISDDERSHARQKAIDAAASGRPAHGFRFGGALAVGAIAAVILAIALLAAGSFALRAGGTTCALNGTPVACENLTTPVPAVPQ